ncbi:hypothetical protein [Clostridium transplantifaecale]|uniref:hypothetical protein n=1 Tax=Clostridium transplantifaecale TaxID=2479838 RepID=UPI001FA968CE|nr:hypothetical protein [Clostridium transplantifaecale]
MKRTMVRRCLIAALISGMTFLYGCGGPQAGAADETAGTSQSGSAGGIEQTDAAGESGAGNENANDTPDYSTGGTRYEILEVKDTYILVIDPEKEYGLYTAGYGPLLEDEKGGKIEISDLKQGMIVELFWNGMVQETYPAQFTFDKLRLTGETGSREFALYAGIMKELAEKDPGLNEGISESYFDFTGVTSLTAAEKEGLAYLSGGYYGVWGRQATAEELTAEGLMDREKGIENGILITLEELSANGNKVKCNATKYRSGTGAYYLNNITAQYSDGEWAYTIGSEAIS